MNTLRLMLLATQVACNLLLERELELYDGADPSFILAVRDGTLLFINESDARLQRATTVFRTKNDVLVQEDEEVCSDGQTGRVLRMCKYSDEYSLWKLRQVPNTDEMFELRSWDGRRCAVHGSMEHNEMTIRVGSCHINVVRFKVLGMDEYLTDTYKREMLDGVRFWPDTREGPWPEPRVLSTRYDSLIPEKLTLNA